MVGQKELMDVHDAWVRGKSISEIARQTGRDRKTIRRLLREGAQAARKPRQISSKLDPFREYLLARMVSEDPVSNAEVLYDEIRELGYRGGRSILKEFMHPFRALAKEKATVRFETPPGRQAQVDWGTFKKPGRKRVQGFVMTLGWSRSQYLDFTDSQALALFLACHEKAFHDFGGVPEEILYDRVKTVWLHDDEHGDPVFHPGFVDFAEYYGFRPRLCRPNVRRRRARPRTASAMCARTSGRGFATTSPHRTCSASAGAGLMRPATYAFTARPVSDQSTGCPKRACAPSRTCRPIEPWSWSVGALPATASSATPAAGTQRRLNTLDARFGFARLKTAWSFATKTGFSPSTRWPSMHMKGR
jgi:transposase